MRMSNIIPIIDNIQCRPKCTSSYPPEDSTTPRHSGGKQPLRRNELGINHQPPLTISDHIHLSPSTNSTQQSKEEKPSSITALSLGIFISHPQKRREKNKAQRVRHSPHEIIQPIHVPTTASYRHQTSKQDSEDIGTNISIQNCYPHHVNIHSTGFQHPREFHT